jgi:hypothetical protein
MPDVLQGKSEIFLQWRGVGSFVSSIFVCVVVEVSFSGMDIKRPIKLSDHASGSAQGCRPFGPAAAELLLTRSKIYSRGGFYCAAQSSLDLQSKNQKGKYHGIHDFAFAEIFDAHSFIRLVVGQPGVIQLTKGYLLGII